MSRNLSNLMAYIECDKWSCRSEEQIGLDAWHELRVSRTAKSGILQVDSQRPVEGFAEVSFFCYFVV